MASARRRNRRAIKRAVKRCKDVRRESSPVVSTGSADGSVGPVWTDGPSGGSALLSDPRETREDLRLINRYGLRASMPPERMAGLHEQMALIVEQHPDAEVRQKCYDSLRKIWERECKNVLEAAKPLGQLHGHLMLPSQEPPPSEEDDDVVDAVDVTPADEQRKAQVLALINAAISSE